VFTDVKARRTAGTEDSTTRFFPPSGSDVLKIVGVSTCTIGAEQTSFGMAGE